MTTDFLLVQKIRNGDNQAGNQLVEKYYSSMYQYCFLHTHNQEYAEDMVQETFVRFFGALMNGAEIGKAKSYLYSIAGNIIKNYYKKKKEILLDQLPDIEKDNLSEIEIRLDVERALAEAEGKLEVMEDDYAERKNYKADAGRYVCGHGVYLLRVSAY